MGSVPVDPLRFLLPGGTPPPQQPAPQAPPAQPPAPTDGGGLPPLPASNNTLDIPQQLALLPTSNNTLEIPQQFDPTAARPELIDAIIHQESGGRPSAIGSDKVSMGLMQVTPQTALRYGITDPKQLLDPKINREVGTRFFGDLLKRYNGNEWKALVAYNEGPGRVDKGQFLPQSVKYATTVLDRAGSRLKGIPQDVLADLQAGQTQMQFPQGLGPQGQRPPQPPQMPPQQIAGVPLGLQGGQPQLQIPPGMGQQPPPPPMAGGGQPPLFMPPGFGQQPPDQQAAAPAPLQAPGPQAVAPPPMGPQQALQQMFAQPGPEEKYGALGAQPFAAMQAGQMFRPQETQAMADIASGATGAIEGVGPRVLRAPRIVGYASKAAQALPTVGKALSDKAFDQLLRDRMSPEEYAAFKRVKEEAFPEEVTQLSRRARTMIQNAYKYGVDPNNIATLSRRLRSGGMSDDQLSSALKDLKKRIPPAVQMTRKYAGEAPREVLAGVNQAVRAGQMTLKQAQKFLRNNFGALGAAALTGAGGADALLGSGQPDQVPTHPGVGVPPEVQQQPGWLSRMGSGISNLLEGTAYAAEPGTTGPAAPAPAAAPPATGGAPGGDLMSALRSLPTAAPTPAPQARQATGPLMRPTKVVQSPQGFTTTSEPPKLPVQTQVQQLSTLTAQNQVNDLLGAFKPLLPRMQKGEFQGPMWTREGLRMKIQPYAASHAMTWQMLGGDRYIKLDPQVEKIYDMLGMLTSSQLHSMIGGRIGAWAVSQNGPLFPHLPNMQTDNLPRMYQKALDMQKNLQTIQKSIEQFKKQGLAGPALEDAVISTGGGDPADYQAEGVPAPPEGFE